MSQDPKLRKKLKSEPGYKVGYAKPPEETRFKPGQSGNPNGRPKGSKNKRSGLSEETLKEIVLAEAYRVIPVKDGDRSVTLPMVHAIVRSMALSAAKGQHRAQKLFTEMLAVTEASRRADHEQWLETAIGYKVAWTNELERRKRHRITDLPEPVPHPDHIEIDFAQNTVRVVGPATKEEKAALDEVIANKHILLKELRETFQAIKETSSPKKKRKLKKKRDEQMELIGFINKLAPPQIDDDDDKRGGMLSASHSQRRVTGERSMTPSA